MTKGHRWLKGEEAPEKFNTLEGGAPPWIRYTRGQLFLAMQSKLQAPVSFLRYDANQGCPLVPSNIRKNVVAKCTWLTPDVISVFLAGCRTSKEYVKATPEAVLQTERRTELRQCNLSISRKTFHVP